MGVMTENLAKGTIFKKLDDRYSDPGRRAAALGRLGTPTSLAALGATAPDSMGTNILEINRIRRPGEYARARQRAIGLGILTAGAGGAPDRINERTHLEEHWFSQVVGRGWWHDNPNHPVEEVLREALIQALEVANARNLSIDTYWVCAGENHPFEAFVCWNPRQVTLIILTPSVPRLHDEVFDYEERPFNPVGIVERTKNNQATGIIAVRRHRETKKVIVRPVRLEDGGSGPIG
jgi:hypothetical protein